MRPLVLLDVDGVLGDFLTPAFEIGRRMVPLFAKKTPADLDRWDIAEFFGLSPDEERAFYDEIKRPRFHDLIRPFPGAQEGVERLREVADLHVVTSPMHGGTWCSERWTWLREHFGIKPRDVTHSHAKHLFRGDALVDDKPETVERWGDAHPQGLALLWDQPYNRARFQGRRASTWDHVVDAVKELT